MSKLTKSQKKAVQEVVQRRLKAFLASEQASDSFYDELANKFSVSVYELTTEVTDYAFHSFLDTEKWLARMPKVS